MDESNVVRRPRRWRAWAGAVVAAAVVVTGLAGTDVASADRPDHAVVRPPGGKPYGKTLGDWSAEHWKWIYKQSKSSHPLYDAAPCSAGQSGRVWFLGGTYTTTEKDGVVMGEVERTCHVPEGTALFFPVLDSECATLEGNPPPGKNLRDCARFFQDHASDMFAEIDGIAVRNLRPYRVVSRTSTYGPLPADNVLVSSFPAAVEGATSEFVSDGVFLMLDPLPEGSHELHWGGNVTFSTADGDPFDFRFEQDITYHIVVD